jgi:hypothetical protein
MAGPDLDHLETTGEVVLSPHPGDGIWLESIIPDQTDSVWYTYYHHEAPALICGRPEAITRIGAARSIDRGVTWTNLGVILEAPRGSEACGSSNKFVLGGVGDVSAMVDRDWKDVYLYFSSYGRDPQMQGVMLARLAWADRDNPQGRVMIWQDGVWLPLIRRPGATEGQVGWEYPTGTPIFRTTSPWHDGVEAANAFWGPSIHWNTFLERYVMLLNRARDEAFNNEGIYVSFSSTTIDDPRGWSQPQKIMNRGDWYPQVAGYELGVGTDKLVGRRARFMLTGRSNRLIDFIRR